MRLRIDLHMFLILASFRLKAIPAAYIDAMVKHNIKSSRNQGPDEVRFVNQKN